MGRDRKYVKPILIKIGVAVAISVLGFLYSGKGTNNSSKPSRSSSSEEPGDDPQVSRKRVNSTSIKSPSADKFENKCTIGVTNDYSKVSPSPSSEHDRDKDGYVLPEFNGFMKALDFITTHTGISPGKHVVTRRSYLGTPKVFRAADYDHETRNVKNMIRILRERVMNLEVQLLECYGRKEQKAAIMELKNRLKISNMEAKFLILKIDSLQVDNQRLQEQIDDHKNICAELDAAKLKIKLLKKKLSSEAGQNKEQISTLQKRVAELQEELVAASNSNIHLHLQTLESLEAEAEELRKSNLKLQLENTELASKLEATQILANSVLEDPEGKILDFPNIYKTKLMNNQAEELAKMLCKETAKSTDAIPIMINAFSTAVSMGISEMVSVLIDACPDVLVSLDKMHRYMSHIAVENRKEKVYDLIHKMGPRKNILLSATDNNKNSVLHLAAKLGPTSSSGAVLQLQRELQWYKEVEKDVQPSFKTMPNSNGKTPKQLFTEEHAKLVEEGEKWMKDTAGACSTVASLITTVAFAGAFTLPGGTKDDGTAVYLHDLSFLIFSISNALALFASATAVLMFLSILTSRYLEEDFLKTLPTRMIIGLSSLFLSIAFMLAAFCSALHIALVHRLEWIVFPLIMLSLVPVAFYAFSQGPLLLEMLGSTYLPGIFKRHRKVKIY